MNYTLVGKKVGMTQVYDESRSLVPVTVIEAGPCPVTLVRTQDKDGYEAIQIGYGKCKSKNQSQAMKGHFAKAQQEGLSATKEVRGVSDKKVGDVLTVSGFEGIALVDVIGITKGRGFQGVLKRWNMQGQPASHGHMMHRRPGSIGMRQTPGHVFKGKMMPGHMGDVRRTVQNLEVVKIIPEKNLILVKGSVPGANGTEVIVRSAVKSKKQKSA